MRSPHPTRFERPSVRVAAFSLLAALAAAACDSAPVTPLPEQSGAGARPSFSEAGIPILEAAQAGDPSAMTLALPYSASANTALGGLFDITQTGTGGGGAFRVSNANSGAPALFVGSSGAHYTLNVFSLGAGRGGLFQITSATNVHPAVGAETAGSGHAVRGTNTGTGNGGYFEITSASNAGSAVWGTTAGSGNAVTGITSGTGGAGFFRIFSGSNSNPAVRAQTGGTGPVILANHTGSSGALAVFQTGGSNRIRFTRAGRGIFNDGTQTGGADVAEAFQVEGAVAEYAPGDVLAISESSNRRVERSSESYSTLVIGVYATRPGVLLTERDVDASLDDMVPVGVVGVIPTRVSAENGAIRRGDLLVTAATPGHAMRGTDRDRMLGAILGKALEPFEGPGEGVIQVMVNVK